MMEPKPITPLEHKELSEAKRYRNIDRRKWIAGGHVDSYAQEEERAEFWVLEGSPPRGFIIYLPGQRVAFRYNGYGELLRTFYK